MSTVSRILAVTALAGAVPHTALGAQQASFIYRLGKDTMAVEQFTRTASRITGDVASRSGAAIVRTQYDAAIGKDSRVTTATYRILGADGKQIKGRPAEVRYAVVGDSAVRTIVWADSTQVRTLAAAGAVPFVAPSYGMLELAFSAMRRGKMMASTFPVLGVGAAPALQSVAFAVAGGDTIRQASGVVFRVDGEGRLQSYDGSATTAKWVASRGTGGLDVASIPLTMAPTPEHVEEFTITIRQGAPNRGALEIAWGSQMATAAFVVHP